MTPLSWQALLDDTFTAPSNPNAQGNCGWTPLHIAAQCENPTTIAICSLLVSYVWRRTPPLSIYRRCERKQNPRHFRCESYEENSALNKEITGRVFLFVTWNHSVKVCLLSKINYWRFPNYSDSPSLCSLHSKTQFHKKWYLLSQSVRKRLTVACNFLFLASFFLLAECLIVNTRVSVFSWTAEQVS